MSKWECIVCGLVYDEAEGWPDDGIAPGTKWEDVPDDWLCPDCGVGKEDFELIEESVVEPPPQAEPPPAVDTAEPVIILGTGLAGYGVAREFRRHDSDTPLILITADDGRAYSKPMLSTGYTRQLEVADLVQMDAGSMAKQLNAAVWTMTSVQSIDTEQQLIHIGSTTVHYGKLVLALGSEVIRPPLAGDALDKVYAVNDLMDYADFRQAMTSLNAKKVCIIGGGLIGCELTNDLLNGGIAVETVDPLGYCLPTLLPEAAGKAVQSALEEKGAVFHFGPLVSAVNNRSDGGVRVELNNGHHIEADLVLSAVGVRARTDLAADAGITVNQGVITDRLLATSAPNVYALGDCAEVDGHALVYVAPLVAAARALGATLAGQPTPVNYPAMPVGIKTPACPVTVAMPPRNAQGQWAIQGEGRNIKALFKSPTGELLGFALTGEATQEKMLLQKELPPLLA